MYTGSLKDSTKKLSSVPGLPNILATNLPWQVGTKDDNEFMFNHVKHTGERAKEYDAILFNSYDELENKAMDVLVDESLKALTVGPLVLLSSHESRCNMASSGLWAHDKECLNWLDSKTTSSVLYIAFGSIAILNITQLHELALGIEATHQPFLWVLRPDLMDGTHAQLPQGFLERTKHRALFIPWAPQPLVLSHPSIGAFLTHCGWNSTMEAISMGVPMLTWPYFGDQKLNQQYIVEEWEVGMSFVASDDGVVDRQEVENVIRSIISGKEGLEMRKRVEKLKDKANFALKKDVGLSYNNLQEIVKKIQNARTIS